MPPYQSLPDWQFDVPTSGSKRLPPAARSFESLAHQGYGFEAAIADLIDNSIDRRRTPAAETRLSSMRTEA
jgi:hypothetical protein